MKRLLTLFVWLSIAMPAAPPALHAQPPSALTAPETTPPTSIPAPSTSPPSASPPSTTPAQATPAQATPAQATPAQATPAQAAPAQAAPAINAADAQRVIDLLNDPKKRADFAATLDAIARTLPPAIAVPNAQPDPSASSLPLVPNSLGAQLLVTASSALGRMNEHLHATLQDLRSIPRMGSWILMMATDSLGQKLLLDTAWRLAVTFAAGLAVEWIVQWLLRGPLAALGKGLPLGKGRKRSPAGDNTNLAPTGDFAIEDDPAINGVSDKSLLSVMDDGQTRAELGATEPPEPPRSALLARLYLLPGVLLRLLLALVPVVAFVLTAHLVVSTSISEVYLTRLILLAMIDAYTISRIVLCAARAILAPEMPRWRLLPMSTATAISGVRWIRWLTVVCVFGYAAAEAGLLLGMSKVTHEALLKADGLILLVMAITIVLRNRAGVAELIRARPGHNGPMARWRKRLASVWHGIAVLYLMGLWLVWAVDVPDGFRRLLNFFVVTMLVAIVARMLRNLLLGLLDRHLDEDKSGTVHHTNLAARMRAYHPMLNFFVHASISVAALIALTQFWGLGSVEWLASNLLAQRMISALIAIAIAAACAIAVWEAANAGIEQHLSKLQRDAQTARSARLRTLLPMLRTALLITILVVVGLIVLSEIGVNIAPLLAGAGVLGIAIGFGSQKLVQDVITGLFLLLENTMQVGDVVLLGGLQGVVEHLSIRTIRLRAEDGSVHVIPFSAVTTVTNMTRDFAHAVIEAQVAYKDDYDEVVEVLRGIVTQMRTEPRWQSEIRDDLEVMGLQRFAESAVVIKCRIRCGPFGRWSVMREFNRRMKMRFDEEGIEIPFPHQKMIIDDQSAVHPAVLAVGHTNLTQPPQATVPDPVRPQNPGSSGAGAKTT